MHGGEFTNSHRATQGAIVHLVQSTRSTALALWLMTIMLGIAPPAKAQVSAPAASSCTRSDFELVVDEAGATLRSLTSKFRPPFQNKLRQLREKRGWSHDDFVDKAAPFVRDDTIVALDRKSGDLLASINAIGEGGSAGQGQPDCTLLLQLRASLEAMVAAQTEKWRYMFAKIDAELAR